MGTVRRANVCEEREGAEVGCDQESSDSPRAADTIPERKLAQEVPHPRQNLSIYV